MSLFNNIVYPTDFSACADHAKPYAHAFAKESDEDLHILYVVDLFRLSHGSINGIYSSTISVESMAETIKKDALNQLIHMVKTLEKDGVKAHCHIKEGIPWKVISEFAEEVEADLIVIGTHGRSGLQKFLFGRTFEKLLRTTKIPILSIKKGNHDSNIPDSPVNLNKVLCPIDFSTHSQDVVPLAAEICREHDASLTLCHVVDTHLEYPQYAPAKEAEGSGLLIERAKKQLHDLESEYSDLNVNVAVSTGIPQNVIMDLVEYAEIDLIVIATHGRSGFNHMLLGSMTEKIVRLVNCPVLIIRVEDEIP